MSAVLDRLRLPIGSLIVDGALVLTLVYSAGQMTERFQVMDRRLIEVERRTIDEKLAQRTAILEQRASLYDRDRSEIIDSLRRIETKLDTKADKR